MRAPDWLVLIFSAALCVFAAAPASAQSRSEVFAVNGVAVDATAANAAAAQVAALADGRAKAFDQLVRRLALPEDLAVRGVPRPTAAQLEGLISGVDVANERRSTVRYLADVSVRFDPSRVRTLLRQSNLRFVETRTPAVLTIAQSSGGTPAVSERWRNAWKNSGYRDALVPLVPGPDAPVGQPDWARVETAAVSAGATTALFVTARFAPESTVVEVIEIGPRGLRRDRGLVTIPPIAGDADYSRAINAAVQEISSRLQNDWKVTALSRSGERGRVQLTARYDTLDQWFRIRSFLAASSLASDIRTDAVARDGALLSIRTAGTVEQLREDLEQRGLRLTEENGGLVARLR
jgi:hypothetical protein